MFDLGSIYPAAVNVTDINGNPLNATTVALTITLPDASVVTPVVINPPAVTGAYTYSYLTVQAGRHLVRWVFTGPNLGFTDMFDVKEANPPSILSLADIKQQLGILPSNTTDDDELRMWAAAATKIVENYKHEIIAQQTIVEIHGEPNSFIGFGEFYGYGPKLRLARVPVIALQSIVAENGSYTWTIGNLDVDQYSGLVTVINGAPVTGRVICTYTAGYAIVPYNYLMGTRILFQHLWESRRGPGGQSGIVGPEEIADFRHYTSMPRKVMEALGPPPACGGLMPILHPYASKVPDVIDALVTLVQTGLVNIARYPNQPDTDIIVRDGPWTRADSDDDVIVIGWAGFPIGMTRPATQMQEELGAAAAQSTGVHSGLAPSIMETMLIECAALSREGTGNVQAARRQAYNMVSIVGEILATPGAGGQFIAGTMQAIMGTTTALHQVQERRGALAVVTFSIQVRAFAQQ